MEAAFAACYGGFRISEVGTSRWVLPQPFIVSPTPELRYGDLMPAPDWVQARPRAEAGHCELDGFPG